MQFELVPVASVDGESILPLADAKAHLRVLDDDEDALIGALRDAAIDMVQKYTSKQLLSDAREWKGQFASPIRLGVGPVTSVTGISYLDGTGAEVALADGSWRLGTHGVVLPAVGQAWPDTAAGDGSATINFVAGYAAGEIPPALISAIKLMLGHLFKNREAVVTGVVVAELPLGFEALCDRYAAPAC